MNKQDEIALINSFISINNNNINEPNNRLFITVTYAQSIDGSLSLSPTQQYPLSNPISMKLTHSLRSSHDAILIGIGTVLADDPSLTTRLVSGLSPLPLLLDSSLRIPLHSKLLSNLHTVSNYRGQLVDVASDDDGDGDGSRSTSCKMVIFTSHNADVHKEAALTQMGVKIIRVKLDSEAAENHHGSKGEGRLDIADVFHKMPKSIRSIMIEGGASIISSMLSNPRYLPFVNRVIVTIAPIYLGGVAAIKSPLLTAPVALQDVSSIQLGCDTVIQGYLKHHDHSSV